jgi:hypothetical protein
MHAGPAPFDSLSHSSMSNGGDDLRHFLPRFFAILVIHISTQPFNMPLNASPLNLIDLYAVDIEK